MASNELVFTLTALVEKETDSLWHKVDFLSSLKACTSSVEEKIIDSTDFKNLIALGIVGIGIVGGLINADVSARKNQKIVDGGVYVLVDLLAQQIACKTFLADLAARNTGATKARWESFCINLRELIQGGMRIESIGRELGKYGVFSSFIFGSLSDYETSLKLRNSIGAEIVAMAA